MNGPEQRILVQRQCILFLFLQFKQWLKRRDWFISGGNRSRHLSWRCFWIWRREALLGRSPTGKRRWKLSRRDLDIEKAVYDFYLAAAEQRRAILEAQRMTAYREAVARAQGHNALAQTEALAARVREKQAWSKALWQYKWDVLATSGQLDPVSISVSWAPTGEGTHTRGS